MSIEFYSERRPDQPREALSAILAALGTRKAWWVRVDHLRSRAWEEELFPTITPDLVIDGAFMITYPPEGATEDLGTNLSPAEVVKLYEERDVFVVSLSPTDLGRDLRHAINREIPERIRGDMFYGDFRVALGPHDVYHFEDGKPVYDARAWVSVCLSGHGSVFYPRVMQPLVEQVPEVIALRQVLEKACGPMRILVNR